MRCVYYGVTSLCFLLLLSSIASLDINAGNADNSNKADNVDKASSPTSPAPPAEKATSRKPPPSPNEPPNTAKDETVVTIVPNVNANATATGAAAANVSNVPEDVTKPTLSSSTPPLVSANTNCITTGYAVVKEQTASSWL